MKNDKCEMSKTLRSYHGEGGKNTKCPGFTLIEMTVTLFIIGLMAAVAGTVYYRNYRAEAGHEATIEILDTVKKAILGNNIPHDRGVNISGYVADMGALPPLNDDNQPAALWMQPTGSSSSEYHENERIPTGWNGPYIQKPDAGCLIDGWGNGLSFSYDEVSGRMIIISYGADMKLGGLDLDKDIIVKINKHHYMAPMGLQLRGDSVNSTLNINYPNPATGGLISTEIELDEFGHFASDAEQLFPIGLRSISAEFQMGSETQETVIVFSIQPGMNYLGTLD